MALTRLPIDDCLAEISAALVHAPAVVLKAPTGAGKTTRVPPHLLNTMSRWRTNLPEGEILVLQPRRLAARTTAARMAFERGESLGQTIGYRTRFDSKVSSRSQIVVMTEGILLRRLLDDSFLDGVAAVVLDEFHERNLLSDLALGMTRQLQQTVRPDLKLVIMSATLDPAPLAAFFGGCPTVISEGRSFPVDVEYAKTIDRRRLEETLCDVVPRALRRNAGDMLVFLPGVGEIKNAARALERELDDREFSIRELYGDLPPEKQDAVLAPSDQRRVILSTNVAETSLTIDGVTAVVDSGLARSLRYDENSGLDRLELGPISQASADQRAGRAGRTAPGVCFRLWTEAAHRSRPAMETPEIRRVELSGALLQLSCWIEPDPATFPWFEPPKENTLADAAMLLRRLQAVDDEHRITPLGKLMARLPLQPRLARMLCEGKRFDQTSAVAMAAAMLSERDPFASNRMEGGRRTTQHQSDSDTVDRVRALERVAETDDFDTPFGRLAFGAAQAIFRSHEQLSRLADELPIRVQDSEDHTPDEAIARAILAGFPDRVAKRRQPNDRRGLMAGGRGVKLADQSAVMRPELFVCVDVEGTGADASVRQASGVEREWLDPDLVEQRVDVFFHPTADKLVARRRTYFGDLVLDEAPAELPQNEKTAQAFVEAAKQRWEKAFPSDDAAIAGFVARSRFLAWAMPELELPSFDDAYLQSLLPELCRGKNSLAEVRRGPWLDYLRGNLPYPLQQAIDRDAPERIQVPSGSKITLEYLAEKPPVLAVRIQELYGLAETPRVAGGRVPVTLHLLGPNMRCEQITSDLASFWANAYPIVRKDLRGRYPKHFWPEDPLHAQAESRPKKGRPNS